MKMELDESMLNDVVGGTVIISKDAMMVGFSTLGVMYKLKNCTYKQARDLRDDKLEENPGLNNKQFDQFMLQQYDALGWIEK